MVLHHSPFVILCARLSIVEVLECPNPLPQLWRGWSVFCFVSFAKGSGVFEYCCCRVNAMPVRMFALSNTKIIHTLSHFLFVPSHCIWGSFIGFTNSSTMASCFLLMKRARRGCIVGEISVAPCVDDVVFSTEFWSGPEWNTSCLNAPNSFEACGLNTLMPPGCILYSYVLMVEYDYIRVIESVSIWSIPVSWSLKDVKLQTKDCKVDGMMLAEGWYSRLSGRGKQSHRAPLWWSVSVVKNCRTLLSLSFGSMCFPCWSLLLLHLIITVPLFYLFCCVPFHPFLLSRFLSWLSFSTPLKS